MKETSKKQNGFYVPTALKATIIITVALFVVIAMTLGGFLIAELVSDGGSEPIQSDGGGSSNKKDPSAKDTDAIQAGVVTPSGKKPLYPTTATKANYLSTSNEGTADASSVISSKSTILVEVGSNTSVAEKNADLRIYPASMTKVMTLVVVCENITSLDTKLEVTQEALDYMVQTEGSGVGLKVGEKLTVKDYIYLMTYQSDTIASVLLAEHVGGTQENFVKMMNDTAAKIGMTSSHFANCTGLHDESNYSTCRDMAALMLYALDNTYAKKMLTEFHGYELDRDDAAGNPDITVYSTWYSGRFKDNPNLKTSTIIGGKTGFEDISGYTLLTYAKGDNGKYYINVTVTRDKTLGEGGLSLDVSRHVAEVKQIYNTYVK
ncbi:MAG: D-alanyl-D-alanine carboxypeptidase [Clostridia bacterium]|nr:D-alanyl-D-alanine carboxypeptidase [Clostridia bacterium]